MENVGFGVGEGVGDRNCDDILGYLNWESGSLRREIKIMRGKRE